MEDAAGANGETRSDISRQRDRDRKKKYMEILQSVADRQSSEICVELDDLDAVRIFFCVLYHVLIVLLQYEKSLGDHETLRLVESIERNAKHYIDILSQAVDKVMPKETKEMS